MSPVSQGAPPETPRDPASTAETEESLWWLASAPLAWVLHLLATYLTAANYCAKAAEDASLTGVRLAIAGYTAVALLALVLLARRGWRRHRAGESLGPHDFDTRADRHRFLGFTLFLLSGAAILGVAFAALPAVFMETCR